ncbi:hypothetical protein ACH4K7_33290 [Streptomyces globisporus]|uniref:hypothetical protein n=1 Tax=Streptomyces globisporus TaxID=1908 RepID=UPI0037BD8422
MTTNLGPSPTWSAFDDPLPKQIRHRLSCGGYQPGQALPTGLLAHYLNTTTEAVMAALAELAEKGEVAYRFAGEHGPAYYLLAGRR